MIRKSIAFAVLFTSSFATGLLFPASRAHGVSFDKPIRTAVVKLGQSKYFSPNDDREFELNCSYYPAFLVKELWAKDWKGTVQVTVTPTLHGQSSACDLSHDDRASLTIEDGWVFAGAKGQLLFWEAPDGLNGGELFRVVDWKTGQKIFEDTALRWDGHEIPFVEFGQASNDKMILRYRRVVVGDCSIPKDGTTCWSRFKTQYGLGVAPLPKCSGYRRQGQKEGVTDRYGIPLETFGTESALVYPVEVMLFPKPTTKVVPGDMKCMASE